jgi:PilZ domain
VPPVYPAYAAVVSESVTNSISEGRQPVQMPIANSGAERRKARRFVLEIPVLFRWLNDGQTAREGAGFCRDISTRGVFVIASSAAPALARSLELMVLLPPLNPTGPGMRLRCSGSVVRVEPLGEAIGLGIASVFSNMEDSEASSSPEEKVAFPCS